MKTNTTGTRPAPNQCVSSFQSINILHQIFLLYFVQSSPKCCDPFYNFLPSQTKSSIFTKSSLLHTLTKNRFQVDPKLNFIFIFTCFTSRKPPCDFFDSLIISVAQKFHQPESMEQPSQTTKKPSWQAQ